MRTTFSRLFVATIWCIFLTPFVGGCGDLSSHWEGPFFFIQMADPQLGMKTANKDMDNEIERFEAAITHANQLRPAFVVICGDLVNLPGDDKQGAEFHRIAGLLDKDIPLHLVSGNHDVSNVPTPDSLAWYRHHFGPDQYAFDHGGCRFIVINSTIMHRADNMADEVRRQDAWITRQLGIARNRGAIQTIVFQHHPCFVKDADEKDSYGALPGHLRGAYLDELHEAGVSAVFAGHAHRNRLAKDGSIELITTGSVSNPHGEAGPGFRIVRVYRDRIEHEYYGLDAIPERVELALAEARLH